MAPIPFQQVKPHHPITVINNFSVDLLEVTHMFGKSCSSFSTKPLVFQALNSSATGDGLIVNLANAYQILHLWN